MALIYIEDNDPWIADHDACEELFREIMEQLTQRESKPVTSSEFASVSVNIRFQLKQYTSQIIQLRKKLGEALRLKAITVEEAERRMRQVEQLESNEIKMNQLYNFKMNPHASNRRSLLESNNLAFADGGTIGWGGDEDGDDPPLNLDTPIHDLRMQNENAVLEQDRGLNELHKVITRQKEIAQTIHSEVNHQHEIIDDLADHMDTTDERLIDGTRRIRQINSKDRTCGYWIIIIILFIAIVCVGLI